jgi:uncharacterized membrane protein YphA (DoxX/SURF4 family)
MGPMAPTADKPIALPSTAYKSRPVVALAALRVGVGILFLMFGEYKVFGTAFTLGGDFQGWINRFLTDGATYPFMVPVLRHVVLPYATPIAFSVAYGELAIGISLVTGVLTRAASACGIVYMLALLFSANYPGPHAPLWEYAGASLDHLVLAMCFVAFAFGDDGRVLSVRAYVDRRQSGRR